MYRLFSKFFFRYQYTNENGESEITCIARGQPRSFTKNDVRIEVSSQKEATLTYLPHEELISNVVDLKPTNGNEELKVISFYSYDSLIHLFVPVSYISF